MRNPLTPSPERIRALEKELFSARIDIDVKGLVRYARVFGFIASILIVFALIVIDVFFFPVANLFTDPEYIIFTYPLTAGIAVLANVAVYYAIISYPKLEMRSRKRFIEASMYEMVSFMYALHHCGATLYASVHSIAKYADFYGDAAKEFRQVVSDMDFCGYDQFTAIQRLADTTPSDKLRFFLSELSSTYRSIGNAEVFLHGKLQEMQKESEVAQRSYLSSLGAIAEMYITLFVAGPLFVVIVIMVIGLISGSDPMILAIVVYLMLPIGTVIFLLLLDALGQTYIIKRVQMPRSTVPLYPQLTIVEAEEDETPLFEKLKKYDKRLKYMEFIRHPRLAIREEPALVFVFSIPLSLITGVVLYVSTVKVFFNPYMIYQWGMAVDDVVVVMLLVALMPYAISYRNYVRRIDKVEGALPDFCRQLSSLVKYNMTLTHAIELTAQEGKSYIQEDIRILSRDLLWGEKLSSALKRFADRMKNLSVDRLVILLSQTEHFTNDLSLTIDLQYHEAKARESLKRERKSDMGVYVVIVFMAFAVFVFVQVIMSEVFLNIMMENSEALSYLSSSSGAGFPAQTYQMIIYHSILIHGFCSGLVAGMMGTGSIKGGIQYSCIMLALGAIAFIVISMVM
ncbi:type II secretion system protein [Methanocorpusculum labreanum Z]|uniref:Type II secretion system protein n=1 Tax=Methanocorpusculum labreanum (strain ATCC 43576 / DSM 4855 / Z) TaxID=410358 RepID=A2STG7_METLZ|nr:type II secretion system F family protein [Methanocorpusculum labreanum]ABN07623.1 type II secretion system protein [Methanocorpusculum labreanum Z]